mmetsp:Transcript_49668/g.105758  ORF Transcript_49668/g.105758 Transcript_49668/m.105758 type:complete len:181 (-) Transcript_49668:244-786(-)
MRCKEQDWCLPLTLKFPTSQQILSLIVLLAILSGPLLLRQSLPQRHWNECQAWLSLPSSLAGPKNVWSNCTDSSYLSSFLLSVGSVAASPVAELAEPTNSNQQNRKGYISKPTGMGASSGAFSMNRELPQGEPMAIAICNPTPLHIEFSGDFPIPIFDVSSAPSTHASSHHHDFVDHHSQ